MQRLELNSSDEIRAQILAYFKQNDEAKFIQRLHGILLKIENQTETCDSIAGILGQSPRSISNWIKKVNEAGTIEVLKVTKRTGRKKKLGANEVENIKMVLQKEPELSGIATNIWDGKNLSEYIQKTYSISLGVRQCQRLLRKLRLGSTRVIPTMVLKK